MLADEMRIGLHGQVRRVWTPPGAKVCQVQQIIYHWQYLAVAVDAIGGHLWWEWLNDVKKESVAEVVRRWHGQGIEAIVWDGAGSHRSKMVREVGVSLVRLPPYSPELNPAERIIEEVRREIEGVAYESLDAKRAEAERFLRELQGAPDRVRRLAGWTWIREADGELAA